MPHSLNSSSLQPFLCPPLQERRKGKPWLPLLICFALACHSSSLLLFPLTAGTSLGTDEPNCVHIFLPLQHSKEVIRSSTPNQRQTVSTRGRPPRHTRCWCWGACSRRAQALANRKNPPPVQSVKALTTTPAMAAPPSSLCYSEKCC